MLGMYDVVTRHGWLVAHSWCAASQCYILLYESVRLMRYTPFVSKKLYQSSA